MSGGAGPPDQPAQVPLSVLGPDGSPIVLTDLRWPFDELNAKGVPTDLPVAGKQVVLTLSMLAALKNGVPSLVQYDDAGRVLATGDRVPLTSMKATPSQLLTRDVKLSAGTEALELKVQSSGNLGPIVSVIGKATGWTYLPATIVPAQLETKYIVQVDTAQDPIVVVTLDETGDPVHPVTMLLTLVKAVDEVTVMSNNGQEPGVRVVAVTDALAAPNAVAYFRNTIGAGANVVLVPSDPLRAVKLYGFSLRSESVTAAPIVTLEDSSGYVIWSTDFGTIVDKTIDFRGYTRGPATGIRLHATVLTPTLDVSLFFRQE